MSLLKNIAGTAARTMHPAEVEQLLEHTLEVMLQRMTPAERVDFAERMLNGSFRSVLGSLTADERRQVAERLLRESAPGDS